MTPVYIFSYIFKSNNTFRRTRFFSGNSLIFVLIIFTILSCLIVPLINIFSYSTITAAKSKNALIALNLALQTIEEVKSRNFDDIATTPTWEEFKGEWISDDKEKIPYPEFYKMFQRQIVVKKGDAFPVKNPKLKEVIVTVRWDELTDERKALTHSSIKLATVIAKENANE